MLVLIRRDGHMHVVEGSIATEAWNIPPVQLNGFLLDQMSSITAISKKIMSKCHLALRAPLAPARKHSVRTATSSSAACVAHVASMGQPGSAARVLHER